MKVVSQDDKGWQAAGRYLIGLLKCALYDQTPEEKPEDCTWEQIWTLAGRNSVRNAACPAIKKFDGKIPEEIWKDWSSAQDQTVYRNLRFEMEREEIMSAMAEKGIAALPLKGILIADYYPAAGMRWMCDNDILYGYVREDLEDGFKLKGGNVQEQKYWQKMAQQELGRIMKKLGYTAKCLNGNHDVYQKSPFFNFEMHRSLVPLHSEFAEYYRNPWKRAVLQKARKCLYRFSDEDEYLFFIVHAYKHFDAAGCGIRILLDEYVIFQKKENMDWSYIRGELEKMRLVSFEQKLRSAACRTFSTEKQPETGDWEIIEYLLGCGTYGTWENSLENKLDKLQGNSDAETRKRYWQSRIWIDERTMKEYYPFFYRHRFLVLLLPLIRLIKGMLIHPGRLFAEWKIIGKYTSAGEGDFHRQWRRDKNKGMEENYGKD